MPSEFSGEQFELLIGIVEFRQYQKARQVVMEPGDGVELDTENPWIRAVFEIVADRVEERESDGEPDGG